ncbi:MAG: hypothetical protein AB8B71_19665 [Paracoccaceae bacterium]
MNIRHKTARKHGKAVTPSYEDRGLFKTKLFNSIAELVPTVTHNTRGDVLIRSFVSVTQEPVLLVFAGRRMLQVPALLQELQLLYAQKKQRAAKLGQTLNVDDVRMPISVQGSWRQRFEQDTSGWQIRHNHLNVAQWSLRNAQGKASIYGELPRR